MNKLALAAIALLSAGAANAAITFTSSPFDAPLAVGETLKVTFDAPNAPGFAVSGTGGIYTGTTPGIAAAPFGNATKYMAVLSGKTAVLDMPLTGSMSVYIGSVDTYNSITFKGLNGFQQTFGGAALVASANGNQTSAGTNRRFYFDFGNTPINRVEFKSSGNSFEFDNIATAAVPEPATWAMLIAGFGLVGLSMRRRRNGIQSVSA
jgi:PEP-CTERM motif